MASDDGPFDSGNNWSSSWKPALDNDDEAAAALEERQAVLDVVQTVAFKLVVPPIVAFGCVGNVINIVVLTRKSMKSSTNSYLTCLAVYDILYLLLAFSMILKHYDDIGML